MPGTSAFTFVPYTCGQSITCFQYVCHHGIIESSTVPNHVIGIFSGQVSEINSLPQRGGVSSLYGSRSSCNLCIMRALIRQHA